MRRLNLYEYEQSLRIAAQGHSFYVLLAALMRQADTDNTDLLRAGWPGVWESLRKRRNAPLGVVEEWDGITLIEYYQSKQVEPQE
jgi:hypothetical protein